MRGRQQPGAEYPERYRRDDEADVAQAEELGLRVVQTRLMHDPFDPPRGWFQIPWNGEAYARDYGVPEAPKQINSSYSVRGVLRGLHWQYPQGQGKLVWVPHGEVFDVAVDIRTDSPTFGRWGGVYLSEENCRQLWVPPGFAHGFLVTSESALFCYLVTHSGWSPDSERGLHWADPDVDIAWPTRGADGEELKPFLSPKDDGWATLAELRDGSPDHLPTVGTPV
ncbi:MAG: dTDP-4-dehydrorhamnose 3,5-epimerase [Planctomycetota bacterium]